MDEKLALKDSSLFWTETDSLQLQKKDLQTNQAKNQWIAPVAVVLSITLILFILFNVRSK